MSDWHQDWFNKDYLKLYSSRDTDEAALHINFLLRETNLKKGRILDLGCGTGRHAAVFAKLGFDVVGVDLSKTLIDEGKRRAEGLPIEWILADFRNLKGLKPFDLVISMFTSFGYFDDDLANEEILGVAAKQLKSNGLFFLDFLNPDQVRESLIGEEFLNIDNQIVKITRVIKADQIIKTIYFPSQTYQERVKLYKKEQIITMAENKGLKLKSFWKGYRPEDFDRQMFMFSLN